MHGHFSAKATEIHVVAMGPQVLYHACFHSENIILEMDAQVVVNELNGEAHDWLV